MLRRATAPKRGAFNRLLGALFARARHLGLIEKRPQAAIDSTGFETRHVSGYFARKLGRTPSPMPYFPKLTVAGDVGSHLIAGALAGRGPSNDCPFFAPVLLQSTTHVRFRTVLADAGYDSESNHRFSRERGVHSVIKLNRRAARRRWPPTPYRREMFRAFPRGTYGRRSHAESIFSAMKRTLGSALRARGAQSQARECLWRVLAFDLRIIRRPLAGLSTEPVRPKSSIPRATSGS